MDASADIADPFLERQLALLGRLAEAGMQLAADIQRQAAEGGAADCAMAFARVSRAVRQTVLLQSHLRDEGREAGEARTKARREARRDRVERVVSRLIVEETDDEDRARTMMREAFDRLDGDDIYGDVLALPAPELVARICRDIGLSPDWTTFAQEAWAQEDGLPSPLMGEGLGLGVTFPPHRSWTVTPTPGLSPIKGERGAPKPPP